MIRAQSAISSFVGEYEEADRADVSGAHVHTASRSRPRNAVAVADILAMQMMAADHSNMEMLTGIRTGISTVISPHRMNIAMERILGIDSEISSPPYVEKGGGSDQTGAVRTHGEKEQANEGDGAESASLLALAGACQSVISDRNAGVGQLESCSDDENPKFGLTSVAKPFQGNVEVWSS